ncbi:hypothetical protein BAE44_0019317, partial [Dichanthelium oligosanthes]
LHAQAISPGKRCCAFTSTPPPDATTPARALPSDLVLDIVARSDAATLVRCAACCKPLRRDILSPAFIRRVCHGPGAAVPPRLLCFLQSRDMIFSSAESRASSPLFTHTAAPSSSATPSSTGLTISVWLLSGGGAGWARHTEIDTETMLWSLVPELPQSLWPGNTILFESSGERSGMVLFYLVEDVDDGGLIALDIETKEMHRVNSQEHIRAFPFEVDLESRLPSPRSGPARRRTAKPRRGLRGRQGGQAPRRGLRGAGRPTPGLGPERRRTAKPPPAPAQQAVIPGLQSILN